MKILKIFASSSKQFRVYGILKKLQIDGDKRGVTAKCKSFMDGLK